MAPTGSNASPSTLLTMKLLVDTKAGRVMFAEAGKEVVDFLFSLLTFPVGRVVQLLSKDAMVGCIGNLYGSVEELDAAYLRSANARNALLALSPVRAPAMDVVYQCGTEDDGDGSCFKAVSVARGAPCRHCGGEMNVPLTVVGSSPAAAGMGFVREVVTYTIMDDLKVMPASTVSGLAALKSFGVKDISSIEEMTVPMGHNECMKLLRASLKSKAAVLTEVFLGKKKKAPSNKKRKWMAKKKSTACPSKKQKGKA